MVIILCLCSIVSSNLSGWPQPIPHW